MTEVMQPSVYQDYSDYQVPESVRKFANDLCDSINTNNLLQIQRLYEDRFHALTQLFFEEQTWPHISDLEPYITHKPNKLFSILYQELYFRHLYSLPAANLKPEHRYESYINYCSLFSHFLSMESPVDFLLPDQWLWDIIDEFIYQFQSCTLHRLRGCADEVELSSDYMTMWNFFMVVNAFHSFISTSNINQQMKVHYSGFDAKTVAGKIGSHPLYRTFGYYSLIGLLRVHCLFGDYYQALKVLENVNIFDMTLITPVPTCLITTFYYVGFCYFMTRRYKDAVAVLTYILFYMQRTRQLHHSCAFQQEQVNKQMDKMYALLAMCSVLYPVSIDDSVNALLYDKFEEKMQRMSRGSRETFETLFMYASPKFLPAFPLEYDVHSLNNMRDPHRLQLRVFMDEIEQLFFMDIVSRFGSTQRHSELCADLEHYVKLCMEASQAEAEYERVASAGEDGEEALLVVERARREGADAQTQLGRMRMQYELCEENQMLRLVVSDVSLSIIRSYLHFYTSIALPKLMEYLEVDVERLYSFMSSFKHKMNTEGWPISNMSSTTSLSSNMDFYIDGEMVHVTDTRVTFSITQHIIRQVNKMIELNSAIDCV